ncbi:hypothetical protein CVT24_006923 [Panaeolus cyanescens]|uniref:glutathione transferase n=1 Tax=Panaeolus cyanescens TaxID=181874 RepID=A0A409VK32_9AGAR|nr:hypothetical protein CVT24_006923 [Panaeolus cyanescens]
MVVKVYGALTAMVWLVICVLKEKNVPYELIDVDLASGEHKSPAFLQKHPFGQTPYIDDDGFILYESRAICYYIVVKYGNQGTPNLVPPPSDLQATALFQQAVMVESHNFHIYAQPAVKERIYHPFYYATECNTALYNQYLSTLEEKLEAYNGILGRQKYLAGDTLTLADLYHLPYGTLLNEIPGCEVMRKYPNVARWFDELSSRQSWREIQAMIKGMYDSVLQA